MKRWLALVLLLSACGAEPTPLPPSPPPASAAAIPEGQTPLERRELFLAAVELYQHGDVASSEPLFQRVVQTYSELADYGLRHLAKAAEARADAAGALALWQRLASERPDSVWIGEADLALGRAQVQAGQWQTASALLRSARGNLADARDRASALALAAQASAGLGDDDAARDTLAELRKAYPRSPEAISARDDAWERRETTSLRDVRSAREEAELLLAEAVPDKALSLIREAEARFGDSSDLPSLIALEATALEKRGQKDESSAVLSRLLATYPRHPAAAQALYRLASSAWNRDQDEDALELFHRYGRDYPRGEKAAEAIYAAGRIAQEARRFPAAAAEFERVARSYPGSSLATEAKFRVGWCWYRAGDRAAATRTFREVARTSSGMDRAAGLYWAARTEDDREGFRAILAEFPESYYATLAERRLGEPEGIALSGRLPEAAAGGVAGGSCDGGDTRHLVRFDELKAMKLRDFARRELAAFQDGVSGCDGFLVSAWVEVDGYRQSIGRALKVGGCGLTSDHLRSCYPLGYWPLVEGKIAEHSLDPYLVAGLIRQESLFDAQIRSAANAVGLMQIIPPTGERLANEVGLSGYSSDRLVEPDVNVTLGTQYMRDLLSRYDGNVPRTLAAYNAGENAVDKWNSRYPGLDDDEFVESISFRETRGYVKRVLQNQRMYRGLYAKGAR